MQRSIFVAVLALLGREVVAEGSLEATQANWEKTVLQPVKAGKFAFVKFQAPW